MAQNPAFATQRIPLGFIVLMGFIVSASAFGTDAILPAVPAIGLELAPLDPQRAHLSVGVFFGGIAFGTMLWGSVSDAFGRRWAICAGMSIYGLASIMAIYAPSLEIMLAARVLQGFGASAMRLVVSAINRDMFSGRMMARVSSFITLLFVIVPGIAPILGDILNDNFGWRGVFWAFVAFSLIGMAAFLAFQPETLPPDARRPLRIKVIWSGMKEVLGAAHNRLCIAVQALFFIAFYSFLSNIQPIFEHVFGRAESFAYIMGISSLCGGVIALTNAWAVMRFGMVRCIRFVLCAFSLLSLTVLIAGLVPGLEPIRFWVFMVWMVSIFVTVNTVTANTMALALQPLPHIAGLAASVQISVAALAATLISIPVTLSFNGTYLPLLLASTFVCITALVLSFQLREIPEDPL